MPTRPGEVAGVAREWKAMSIFRKVPRSTETLTKSVSGLQELLTYAAMHVPYYRDLQLDRKDISSLADGLSGLQEIPFLTKEICRENNERLVSDEVSIPDLHIEYTSGTTGTQLRCVKTRWERLAAERALWKARLAWDRRLLHLPTAEIGGSVLGTPTVLTQESGRHIVLTVGLNSQDLQADLRSATRILNGRKPALIVSFTNVMSAYAEMIDLGEIPGLDFAPLLVEVTGEQLTNETRGRIEGAFGCPVADKYACEEVYTIAYSCPEGQLHLIDRRTIVELLSSTENHGSSELVVTSTRFRAMPFVRYRLGDLVQEIGPDCRCHSDMPAIGMIRGRTSDAIFGHKNLIGSIVFPLIIREIANSSDRIRQYRVIQRDVDTFTVFLVPGPAYQAQTAEELRRLIQTTLGPVRVAVCIVQDIPPHPTGKTRVFVSELGTGRLPTIQST